jgi:hypothetical protein
MIQLGGRSCLISLILVSHEIGRANKNEMCLSATYSRVRVGNHLFDTFPIKNGLNVGDALSPLYFNFALEYAIREFR